MAQCQTLSGTQTFIVPTLCQSREHEHMHLVFNCRPGLGCRLSVFLNHTLLSLGPPDGVAGDEGATSSHCQLGPWAGLPPNSWVGALVGHGADAAFDFRFLLAPVSSSGCYLQLCLLGCSHKGFQEAKHAKVRKEWITVDLWVPAVTERPALKRQRRENGCHPPVKASTSN